MPLNVEDGDELGIRNSDLPEGLSNIDTAPDNKRSRMLKNMDWKSFAEKIFEL